MGLRSSLFAGGEGALAVCRTAWKIVQRMNATVFRIMFTTPITRGGKPKLLFISQGTQPSLADLARVCNQKLTLVKVNGRSQETNQLLASSTCSDISPPATLISSANMSPVQFRQVKADLKGRTSAGTDIHLSAC